MPRRSLRRKRVAGGAVLCQVSWVYEDDGDGNAEFGDITRSYCSSASLTPTEQKAIRDFLKPYYDAGAIMDVYVGPVGSAVNNGLDRAMLAGGHMTGIRLRKKLHGEPIDETFTGTSVRMRTTIYKHTVNYDVLDNDVVVWTRQVEFSRRHDNMAQRFEAARAQETEAIRRIEINDHARIFGYFDH